MKTIHFLFFLFIARISLSQSSQVFTSNGNFTVPNGVSSITIEVVGAGGNGAGNGGGGGGGGGYAKGIFAVTPGTVLTVNIGSAGGGSTGGASSVSGLISASGGGNGTTVSNPSIGGGGTGGSGSNGNVVNRTGGNGGGAYWTYFGGGGGGAGGPASNGNNGGNTVAYNGTNCLTPGGSGGTGGGAPGGNGGKGAGFVDSQCNTADPAAAGANYGGGGGGGNGNSSPAQNGAGGYCKIEYGCTAPNPPANGITNMTVCSGDTTALVAVVMTGTVNWFTTPAGGNSIYTGTMFITPPLTTTTTFYAEVTTCTTSAQRTAFTVTVYPKPVITLSISPGPYCRYQTYTLTAGGGLGYQWNLGGSGNTKTISPQSGPLMQPFVMGYNAQGCWNQASLSITASDVPSLSISPTKVLCQGLVGTYTVGGASTYTWSNGVQASSFTIVAQSNTVFTVSGTSTAGCTNTAAVSQSVMPNLTVTISGPSKICKGETILLIPSGADVYSWTGLGPEFTQTVSPGSTTVYTVTGSSTNACFATVTKTVTVDPCTELREPTLEDHFSVYPNPSTGVFTIHSQEDLTLHLYSGSGQLLQTYVLNTKNNRTLMLETLSKGVYFLSDDKRERKRTVIVD